MPASLRRAWTTTMCAGCERVTPMHTTRSGPAKQRDHEVVCPHTCWFALAVFRKPMSMWIYVTSAGLELRFHSSPKTPSTGGHASVVHMAMDLTQEYACPQLFSGDHLQICRFVGGCQHTYDVCIWFQNHRCYNAGPGIPSSVRPPRSSNLDQTGGTVVVS
jgi:hypothetical protein